MHFSVMVNEHDEALFFALPKTGSQTVKAMLHGEFGGRFFSWKDPKGGSPGWRAQSLSPVTIRSKIDLGFEYLISVRCPYSRAVSMWWSTCKTEAVEHYGYAKKAGGGDFTNVMAWVVNGDSPNRDLLLSQYTILSMVARKPRAIVRHEHFAADLKKLPWFRDREILEMNRSKSRAHWTTYFTDDTVHLVNQWAAEDFPMLGYKRVETARELRDVYA